MLNSTQFAQPALPGFDNTPQIERAKAAQPFVEFPDPRRHWSGPMPGQQVMGVHSLGGDGPWKHTYEVDHAGMVQEPTNPGQSHLPTAPERHVGHSDSAVINYIRWGGIHGKDVEHPGPDAPQAAIDAHERRLANAKRVREHWDAQPLVHVRSDAPVHSGQHHEETLAEGDDRIERIRGDLQHGGEIQNPAWLIKKAGRLYALDGHHRIAAARQEGRETYPARVYDMDAERAKNQQPRSVVNAKPGPPPKRGN